MNDKSSAMLNALRLAELEQKVDINYIDEKKANDRSIRIARWQILIDMDMSSWWGFNFDMPPGKDKTDRSTYNHILSCCSLLSACDPDEEDEVVDVLGHDSPNVFGYEGAQAFMIHRELELHCLRYFVKMGKVSADRIVLICKDKEYFLDQDGRITDPDFWNQFESIWDKVTIGLL